MSTIQNDRDALLLGTAVRFYPPPDRAVILGASAGSFRIPASGGGTPASITLTAVVLGMPGNVQWTASPDTILTVNGNQAVLKLADMADDAVAITASITRDGVTYQGRQTIYKMYDGRQGASTGLIQAYKRAAAAPTDNPGAVTFTFSQGKITTPNTDALANGWSKSIPAGTDPLYVTVASASAAGDTDQVAAAEWSAPVMLAQNGISGLNAATVFLYRRTTTNVAPAKPTADVTYTFASGVATGLTSSWTQNVPAASGGGFLWVTTATAAATTATDTIAPAEWAAVQLMAQNGSDGIGYDGQRGTVDVVVAANYWPGDLYTQNQLFYSTGYSGPYNRDRMTLTNSASGGSFSETRFYDNGEWKAIAAYINGNLLVSGTVAASKISAGTMTGQTIQTAVDNTYGRVAINESSSNSIRIYYPNVTAAVVDMTPGAGNPGVKVAYNHGQAYAISASNTANFALNASGFHGAALTGSGSGGSGLWAYGNATDGAAIQIGAGANGIVQNAGGTNWLRTLVCSSDAGFDLGAPSSRWRNIYASSSVISTSDARTKIDVTETILGLDFINDLRPVSYRMKVASNDVTDFELEGPTENGMPMTHVEVTPREGRRRHYGLIAQDVRDVLIAHGADDAAFWVLTDPSDPESPQALRYEELIAPLIRAVQELASRVQLQEQQIQQMKGA